MIYNCLIADDEQPARALIASFAAQLPYLKIGRECENGVEALQALKEQSFDILFLDIQMPNLKGTDVAPLIQGDRPVFIFTTAYEQYALSAFDLNAVDYLLKPFSFERFVKAVDRAIGRLNEKTARERSPSTADFMMVKSEHKLLRVNFSDILYIEAFREYIRIVMPDQKILTLDTMKNMEAILPGADFCRIHKSYIAATRHVNALYGNQLEIDGQPLPIGRSYRQQVMERFNQTEGNE